MLIWDRIITSRVNCKQIRVPAKTDEAGCLHVYDPRVSARDGVAHSNIYALCRARSELLQPAAADLTYKFGIITFAG